MKFNEKNIALITGVMVSSCHILWSILVLLGWGQFLLDFIYSIHFLINPFIVTNFNLTTALILVIVTFIVGYIFGYLGTLIWNKMIKK
ncbi:hypothetical protein A2W13_01980 [Candidatus Woesebacteria bacterium RBG_16_36_11]|uniref:DUF2062 domain-containing protein n=2 Tax=Candidatus Woeseibacteriota TaxID=1752722 RepID=A0A1F7XBI7_9BACT|nr:MAG: hypothetical protein A2Z67_04095 [Candidatus Woesebacteria bacterium RBG_13_36_22]OGM12390.1 MAG: hypothetical protein A2W13_01980 [Candidatus Woesebacteria bacterium RBG_16_36_11]